jgi:plastocyanin
MKKRLLLSLVVALCTSLAMVSHTAQAASAASAAPVNTAADSKGFAITIDNFSFSPATLTVPAGTSVMWTNNDDIPHTVVEKNQKFKSKGLDTDDKFSYTFTEPGTYEYFCGMHPKMVGKVIVEARK